MKQASHRGGISKANPNDTRHIAVCYDETVSAHWAVIVSQHRNRSFDFRYLTAAAVVYQRQLRRATLSVASSKVFPNDFHLPGMESDIPISNLDCLSGHQLSGDYLWQATSALAQGPET
mmetsp:Transcript_46274/g.91722  ORF Transcript_46274/g.91722 Transcript_46274/m.91722 type:complete len:119 (+) Transcript_46274:78-434(+)